MKKILITTLLLTSCSGMHITKPLVGHHFGERGNGKPWNEDYSQSIGVGYRFKKGVGFNYTYAAKNSIGNRSNYIHAEMMPTVWNSGKYSLALGGAFGVRQGYPKKIKNRTKDSWIPSGALQGEFCRLQHCGLLQLAPTDTGLMLLSYKFKF